MRKKQANRCSDLRWGLYQPTCNDTHPTANCKKLTQTDRNDSPTRSPKHPDWNNVEEKHFWKVKPLIDSFIHSSHLIHYLFHVLSRFSTQILSHNTVSWLPYNSLGLWIKLNGSGPCSKPNESWESTGLSKRQTHPVIPNYNALCRRRVEGNQRRLGQANKMKFRATQDEAGSFSHMFSWPKLPDQDLLHFPSYCDGQLHYCLYS